MDEIDPHQMYEIMKQFKQLSTQQPDQARLLLQQNPQLCYALLRAQLRMKMIDPELAQQMIEDPGFVIMPSEARPPPILTDARAPGLPLPVDPRDLRGPPLPGDVRGPLPIDPRVPPPVDPRAGRPLDPRGLPARGLPTNDPRLPSRGAMPGALPYAGQAGAPPPGTYGAPAGPQQHVPGFHTGGPAPVGAKSVGR